MELAHLTPTVADQYREHFGDAGAFDTALFPELATQSLMAEALRRDSPVIQEDLEAMHQTLYRLPMPAPDTAHWPSGQSMMVPSATTQEMPPMFYAAPQAIPVVEEAPPAPVEEEPRATRRERRQQEAEAQQEQQEGQEA
jgi:hypothetical protein